MSLAITPDRAVKRIGTAVYYFIGIVLSALFLGPIAWALFTSIHGARATGGAGGFGGDNYVRLFNHGEGLLTYVWNTTVVTGLSVIGTLLVTVLGGYALSRFKFPGQTFLLIGAMAILMVPHPTILIPIYTMFNWVSLQNSLVGVSLVLIMFQLPFGLFLMKNGFAALPPDLEEAALLDGCDNLGALRRILLPAVRPSMVTVGMFAFLAAWNEFLTPLILLTQGSKFTLPIALVTLRSGELGAIDLGALQAGIVVAALPCLLMFIVLQRSYVRGFSAGAVRG